MYRASLRHSHTFSKLISLVFWVNLGLNYALGTWLRRLAADVATSALTTSLQCRAVVWSGGRRGRGWQLKRQSELCSSIRGCGHWFINALEWINEYILSTKQHKISAYNGPGIKMRSLATRRSHKQCACNQYAICPAALPACCLPPSLLLSFYFRLLPHSLIVCMSGLRGVCRRTVFGFVANRI